MITYVKGDATNPMAKGIKVIIHICNTEGKWGKGFVMAVSKKWPKTREQYLAWYRTPEFGLGEVQFVECTSHIWVANMIGQKGIRTGSKGPPIRYDALKSCLEKVAQFAKTTGASVHMPRIGTGLAQGSWTKIEPLIEETLKGLAVTVYDF